MPPVPQYSNSPTSAATAESTANTMNTSTDAPPVSGPVSTGAADATTATGAAPGNPSPVPAGMPGAAMDWRDKDADRSARQQIARIILTLIMRSSNRPASVNYNPREIARRLEHTLYMSATSKEDYSNVQTLKTRLQQALDNSRRRQMLQRQQQQSQTAGVAAMQPGMTPQQIQAQQMQQQQLQLLQRQQQQMAAQLQSQRNSFSGVPFAASPGGLNQQSQQAAASQPLQMPMGITQMSVKAPAGLGMPNASAVVTTPTGGTGNSILDELEREADEMANGVSDEPIAMPDSELQVPASIPMPTSAGFSSGPVSAVTANMVPSPGGSFSAMPLSMPPEISGGVASSIPASAPFVQPANSTMMAATSAAGTTGTNLYHGMNLTGPQIQQIQQIQQMQQLRRMQQMHQLQQQQLNANAVAGMTAAQTPAAAVAVATPAPAGSAGTPRQAGAVGMVPMNEASIAQKREELKRRLIQLKHARTCTTGECAVDYCNRTKALLAHVSRCANAQCTTIGCKSTRQLLSHFRKCRNLQCDVCSAIRPPMNENEQQLVLRRQQERLCMLRHASTCAQTQCILPYCAGMKVLWKHICECHQRQCRTDHCISSRYVLSHFKQCNKMICEVCGPVRKAIKIVDSCRTNPAQLQIIASQCPETVRGLIKIMNTTAQNSAVAGMNGSGEIGLSNQMKAGPGGEAGQLQANSIAGGQPLMQGLSDGSIKLEANGVQTPSADAVGNGNGASGLKSATSLDQGQGSIDPTSTFDDKKKPLKLQTEKEKKLRRKEQAKRMKERKEAKNAAIAGSSVPGASVAGTVSDKKEGLGSASTVQVLPNGLVVRGRSANLRNGHHISHQDISFLDSMTEGQLDEHIRSLRFNFCGHITLTELKNRLMPLLTKLMESEYGWTFNNPVDPVQWNIPDYFDIIKCPMDLGTIKKRLENEHYNSVEAFAGDVRLVFENCIAYNSSTNKFNIAAKQLLASFNRALTSLKNQLEKQLFKRCEQRREEMCQLCGGESFKFAPCMLFCSGPCAGRIRRHTHYYSDPRGEHHWCSSCFKQMKDGPIDMSLLPQLSSAAVSEEGGAGGAAPLVPFDGILKKSSLVKRKNSEVAEEPWVECDSCKLWYHQICALFNERNHAISGEQEPFVCPICVKKNRAAGMKPSLENGLKARRLPITRMAKLIETRVLEAIATAHKEEAIRMGKMGNSDSIGFSNGVVESTSETQFGITIREVLSVDKQVQIKPKMGKLLVEHYGKSQKADDAAMADSAAHPKSLKRQRSTDGTKKKKQPKNGSASTTVPDLELTYRSRCICVFQELDGVDVLIFTLYVQEYGPDSLEPNAGRVYVSYLDSVNYFQPKKLRTLMHQHVMLGFLEDCKNRGFHTCHIWSCPPLKGDDYIFFCKPENQKIPKSARLRQWYQKLLQEAKKEGLVINISNLYAEYYMKKKAAHELPYFEGDYWPRLAEDLIKQLEEKGNGARTDKPGEESNVAIPSSEGGNGTASGTTTPLVRSPTPSDASAQSEGTADEPASAATTPTGAASKAGVNAKIKSKRTKKGAVESSGTMTRSSATKARSKKGSTMGRPSSSSKTVVNSDPLMQKLKGILEPQKDDFFVVDLHPKCHKCASPIVHVGYWELKTLAPPEGVTQLLETAKKSRSSSARNTPPRHYHHYYCTSCYETNKTQLLHRVEVASNGAKRARELSARILPMNEKSAAAELAELDLQEIKFELELVFVDPQAPKKSETEETNEEVKTTTADAEEKKQPETSTEKADSDSADAAMEETPNGTESNAEQKNEDNADSASQTEATDEKKEDDGNESSTEPAKTSSSTDSEKATVSPAGDKVEDDVIMPCEIFDTREAFLLYCQNNHCQFDQIRRAKHSSMMVLYHLFNQGTTGFTFNCTNCKITLLSGNRWNCSICPLFNLCDACNAKIKHEHTLHSFKVVAIPRIGDEVPATSAVDGALSTGADGSMTREPGSSQLKRAKIDTKDPKGKKGTSTSRKRKLGQTAVTPAAPVAVPGSTTPNGATTTPAAAPAAAAAAAQPTASTAAGATPTAGTPVAAANGNASAAEDAAKKQRRIHNIDPQLLLQLEHASSCTTPNCTFFNCARMQAMLKHGSVCEQRLAGPCVLCKRIVGLLSAHARQCSKEYSECKVPRCGDIRRHFLQQMQQRQQQLLRARQQQQLEQQQAAAGSAPNDAAS